MKSLRCLSLAAALLGWHSVSSADPPPQSIIGASSIPFGESVAAGPGVDALKAAVGLSQATMFTVPKVNDADAFEVAVPIGSGWADLELFSHSIRSDNYKLFVQGADGVVREVEPGAVNTLRGSVRGLPGASVAGGWSDAGLELQVVMPDGSSYWIEPVRKYVADAPAGDHFVYRAADVTNPAGMCGVDIPMVHGEGEPPIIDLGSGDCGGMCVAQVGCDADVEFYQQFGSSVPNVEARINLIINNTSNQYESQCGIMLEVSGIVVRTAEPDPYSSSDGGTLLSQFQSEWLANQDAIERDLAHLFTGKDITTPGQGASTIGIASLAVVCTDDAFGTVEHITPNSCAFDLSAHEIGHNWSAQHCCSGTTMAQALTCANNFAAQSINEIVAHRNTRTCLDPDLEPVALPFFDSFPLSSLDATKWSANGASVSTLGNGEPSTPNSCRVRGQQTLTSAPMVTSATSNLTVSYWWQRTGSGNSPENGENLVVEYFSSTGDWVEIAQHPGTGSDTDPFQFESFVLTDPNAYHADFRIRFRNPLGEASQDDFFIDDVGVDAQAVAPGAFSLLTPAEGATNVTQNPLFLDWGTASAAANYTVTVDNDADFSSPNINFNTVIASQLSVSGSPLSDGLYYWRVRANNANGQTFGTPNPGTFWIGNPPPNCPGDTNGDNTVNVDDLNGILGAWNTNVGVGSPLDVAGDDGFINVDDLNVVLGAWNTTCP